MQFSFVGIVDRNGRFPIVFSFLDIDNIKEDIIRTIESGPDKYNYEFGEVCYKVLGCSQKYLTLRNALGRKYIIE